MRDFFVPKDLLLFSSNMGKNSDFSIRGFGGGQGEAISSLTTSSGAEPVPTDPHWANVVLCINPAGAHGSTNILDAKGKSITVGGDAAISTGLGYPAVWFDGAGDFLKIPYSADLAFGSADFTVELFVRKSSNVANTSRLWNNDGDFAHGIDIIIDGTGKLAVYASTNGSSWNLLASQNVATLANDTDYYISIARDGGTLRCGVNGTVYVLSTTLGAATLYNGGRAYCIGGQSVGISRSLHGLIRGYRVTKGVARDVSSVPTLPFPEA